jgi:RND family efflux transporter MFP subunit
MVHPARILTTVSMKHPHLRLASVVIPAGILLSACGKRQPSDAPPETGAKREVRVKTVGFELQQATEEVVGTVRSKQRAVIEAKVSGRVLQYLAVPGQPVKAGELLAEVDAREILARREQAAATLEQADKDLIRYKQLISTRAISQQDYDAVEARQKVAVAGLSEAETMLGYARVTAPFDGVITRKLADVGDLAMPGKALMEIEAPGSLRFEADMPEAVLDRVKPGDRMRVTVASIARPFEGVVSEIAPVADAASRTFQVKFDLTAAAGLRSGQFGRVSVPVAEARVLQVPAGAVIKRGQMELVFIVRDGRAVMRLVRTGKAVNGGVGVLSGIEEGERVVTGDVAGLGDGQPVTIQP